MTTTTRWSLPLMEPGQAQKELVHNEALVLLDAAAQAGVAAVGVDRPPASPPVGESWVTGAAPVDEWSDRPRQLAIRTAGGWRFLVPVEGMAVWDRTTGALWRYRGGMWFKGNDIPVPTGGATIDREARAVLAELIDLLRGHGLVAR